MKRQVDKTCLRARVSLSAFSAAWSTEGEAAKSDAGVGLLCDGQVGAKHQGLAC